MGGALYFKNSKFLSIFSVGEDLGVVLEKTVNIAHKKKNLYYLLIL